MDPYTWLYISLVAILLFELLFFIILATIIHERRNQVPSNLPPGCSVNDIPGNRPEDLALEAAEEGLMDALSKENLSPDEYKLVADVGIAAVKAHREVAKKLHEIDWENHHMEIHYHQDREEELENQLDETRLEIEHLKHELMEEHL